MPVMVWFRSDLRIRDNTALHHACRRRGDCVIGVFAICPGQWRLHDWGSMRVDFVLRGVRALSESLATLNIPLLLVRTESFAELPPQLLRIARRHRCASLYFNKEYEVNEMRRDREVAALFERQGLDVHMFVDQTILDVGDMRTGTGGWYSVFTPFKRKWHAILEESGPPTVWPKPRRLPDSMVKPSRVPATIRGFVEHREPNLWPATETAACKRLRTFVSKHIERYDQARDFPWENATSTLSPYLASGLLSPRRCLMEALQANAGCLATGDQGATTWITQLIWREFYRHVLIGFPRVCMNRAFRSNTDLLAWRHHEQQFDAWREGRTGVPIVDAGMRQLAQTGWMHNRLRMIVAMFLTKDLFIDWRWGERHFMQHLADGDFANNNGGWQWSASAGTDAVPYFRVFNPVAQSRRFDPDGHFIRRFVPELRHVRAAGIHDPRAGGFALRDYPKPIVDHRKTREAVTTAFRSLPKRQTDRPSTPASRQEPK